MNEVIRYVIAGLLNTAAGYGVFLIVFKWAGYSPQVANATGYVIALTMAFLLNRFFVFTGVQISVRAALRFFLAFIASFALNQLVLLFLIQFRSFLPEIAQIFAMVFYTVSFYIFNKYFVFS